MNQKIYRAYPSSQDPTLRLFANFIPSGQPRPILVAMHGWHGSAKEQSHPDNIAPSLESPWFLIQPDMRGRADSTGLPDCNGWELQDVIDAVDFARREYAAQIISPDAIYLTGGSGGGGNVLALIGKFPDFFCAAVCEAGISDYGLWYQQDQVGEFRDEMESRQWIGGSPSTHPEAYASRGGLTTLPNLLTPLALTHGELDPRCPVIHARQYAERARQLGLDKRIEYFEMKGVAASGGHFGLITPEQERQRQMLIQRHLMPPRSPVTLPRRGQMTVAGSLKTRAFEVIFDTPDRIGLVEYDLDRNQFKINACSAPLATLRVRQPDNSWQTSREIPRPIPSLSFF